MSRSGTHRPCDRCGAAKANGDILRCVDCWDGWFCYDCSASWYPGEYGMARDWCVCFKHSEFKCNQCGSHGKRDRGGDRCCACRERICADCLAPATGDQPADRLCLRCREKDAVALECSNNNTDDSSSGADPAVLLDTWRRAAFMHDYGVPDRLKGRECTECGKWEAVGDHASCYPLCPSCGGSTKKTLERVVLSSLRTCTVCLQRVCHGCSFGPTNPLCFKCDDRQQEQRSTAAALAAARAPSVVPTIFYNHLGHPEAIVHVPQIPPAAAALASSSPAVAVEDGAPKVDASSTVLVPAAHARASAPTAFLGPPPQSTALVPRPAPAAAVLASSSPTVVVEDATDQPGELAAYAGGLARSLADAPESILADVALYLGLCPEPKLRAVVDRVLPGSYNFSVNTVDRQHAAPMIAAPFFRNCSPVANRALAVLCIAGVCAGKLVDAMRAEGISRMSDDLEDVMNGLPPRWYGRHNARTAKKLRGLQHEASSLAAAAPSAAPRIESIDQQ